MLLPLCFNVLKVNFNFLRVIQTDHESCDQNSTNHPGPNNIPKISVNCIFHSPLSSHQTIVPMYLRNKRFTMKYKKELKAISNAVKFIRPKCYLTIPYSLYTLWEYREGRLFARSPTKSLGYIGNQK